MNDWLDYKGSGSSRAYMGNTIDKAREINAAKQYECRSAISEIGSKYHW